MSRLTVTRFFIGAFAVLWSFVPAAAAPPARLVALLPSHREIVQALGAGAALVGVSDAEAPRDVPGLPRAGGLSPRWEVLLSLRPDLVLADSTHERFAADFARFHVPVRFYPVTHAKTVEDVFALIAAVGTDIGRAAEARALVSGLARRLAALDAAPPPAPRPRVLFEIWPRPLQAVGPVSLQGNLLARAGLENIVPDTGSEMPLLSPEWAAAARPDIILHTGLTPSAVLAARPGWGDVPAVKNGRVIALDADLFSRAGPRIVDALDLLRKIARGETP